MVFAKAMDGVPPGANLDRLMGSANRGWGFADELGSIEGPNGFRVEAGKVFIGDINLATFLRKSDSARVRFLESDVFSPSIMSRVDAKISSTFASDLGKSLKRGAAATAAAADEFMDASGRAVKAGKKVQFGKFMDKFTQTMKFGAKAAVATWGIVELLSLVETGSGCFLVGPDGQEEKVAKEDCSCTGPNGDKCCNACNAGGDAFLCPDMEWDGPDPPPAYVCPSVVGRARQMRSSISAAAARARDHAQSMPQLASAGTAVSCGCVKAGEWRLETREKSVFGVIGELLAAVGKVVKQVADGALEIVGDGLDKLMGPLKSILIVAGVVLGVGALAGITVVVLKAKKRKA